MLSVLLLGPPILQLDAVALTITRRRSRALIYYLAAQRGPTSREQLLALLWPEHDRSAAQQLLRTTLHSIRRARVELASSDQGLTLPSGSLVDAHELSATLARPPDEAEPLATALAYYRGEFLAEFSLPDCPAFEGWLAGERERYRQIVLHGMGALAARYKASANYTAAREVLTRALEIEPLREDLQQAAMRLHYLMGDRAGAIRRFEQLRDLLDNELGVPPMAETQRLYDAIVTDSLRGERETRRPGEREREVVSTLTVSPAPFLPVSSANSLPFIGRRNELARLQAAAEQGWLGLIEGEPGIGKTRLAEEFLHTRGGIVLIGAARELEQALPYQPLIEALRGLLAQPSWPSLRAGLDLPELWLSELARLLPELQPVAPPNAPADESRLWEAVNRLLQSLARQQPVALLLDDLQWAGGATVGLLGYLARQERSAALCFVATARHSAPRTPLAALAQALTREQRLERLSLGRLAPSEMFDLAQTLSPTYAQPLAAWLGRSAEGNPYMLAELVRHARAEGLLLPNGTLNLSALSEVPVVPQTIYSLIHSRLAGLSPAARQILDAGVTVGREFEFTLVAQAAELDEASALDALDELVAVRLLQPLGEMRYGFDHSLTMEVAWREVGEPRHRLFHRRIGAALEVRHQANLDPVAGLIASHFAEGLDIERAASYALRAGRQATRLAAWDEAIGFFEQALAATPAERGLDILLALAEAYQQAGQAAQAGERYRTALTLTLRPEERHTAHLGLANALLSQARFAELISLAQQMLQEPEPRIQGQGLFLWGTALSVEGSDLGGAAERLAQAEALFENQAPAEPVARAQVRFELGSVAAQRGELAQAIVCYRETLAVAEADGTEATIVWRVLAHNNLGYHLHLIGSLDEATAHVQAGLALVEERGLIGQLPFLYSTAGEIALAKEELDAAQGWFAKGLALAERLQIPERMVGLRANLGLLAARRGDLALAVHQLSTALAHADELGTRHLATQVRIWLAPLLPPAAARTLLAEARAIAEAGGRARLLDEIARLEA